MRTKIKLGPSDNNQEKLKNLLSKNQDLNSYRIFGFKQPYSQKPDDDNVVSKVDNIPIFHILELDLKFNFDKLF
ncbi:hypothetical protein BpHYR1_008686 [Brachionus plicatilis]|uniref:Uncharacterized protein n=1 Tax=Brachionus plicatilis TaxID=10195 RepID=A0A3M7RI30_BRAPC|nr:hypothetical protein BpHYR1_008686 [Brachionus plicatilis]